MCFAWQGWRISIPADWNPQRLEGNFDAGHALISDPQGPRLGLRWNRIPPRADLKASIDGAMRGEVGQLAAKEVTDVILDKFDSARQYIEPDPPGRDLWMGRSTASGRLIQISVHRRKGESAGLMKLLSGFSDTAKGDERPWAVFDLNCCVGGDWQLSSKTLNAGDLSLSFRRGRDHLACRQLALAGLALKRQPMDRWLREISRSQRMQYVQRDEPHDQQLQMRDGRILKGIAVTMQRKAWLKWALHLPKEWAFAVYHDEQRDRLMFGQSTQASELDSLCRSFGTVR